MSCHPARWLALALAAGLGACGDDGAAATVDAPGAGADASWGEARPGGRSDLVGVADPTTGRFVIFGGDDGPVVNQQPQVRYLDETWLLDPTTGWAQATGAGPSARGRHAAALDGAGRMLMFGGRYRATGATGNYTLHADLWALDLASQAWTRLHDGAGGPAPRYFATMVHDAATGRTYVHGGGTNVSGLTIQPASDTWVFDGAAWTQLTTTGTAPTTRVFIAGTHDPMRGRLVVYGGQVGDFVSPGLGDLYALDLATGVWSRLHDGSGMAPAGRFSATLSYDATGDRYLMFGGHVDPGTGNDLWAFDPTAGTWSVLAGGDMFTGVSPGCLGNPREIPADYVTEDPAAPERRSTPAVAALPDRLVVFGGESDCTHLDDVWTFDLAGGGWAERLAARTGESCARRGDACSCLCL